MKLEDYFKIAIEKNASDLHLIEGSAPTIRVGGELKKISSKILLPEEVEKEVFKILNRAQQENFKRNKDLDFSHVYFENNFRINFHCQEGKVGLSARLIPKRIPTPEEIMLEETIYKFARLKEGLIIVTGPAGVGKSTTLAVMIDIINADRRAHIITIEDPIEYQFEDKQSIVEQRQLDRDTNSFSSALKYAMRQDPNVIMVGEMRDLETIKAVLAAAKTGHLVLSTLHTPTAAETISRIVDFFPPQDHQTVADELSLVLRGVISQRLLPSSKENLVPAREILINNQAVSNLIKNNKIDYINSVIQTSKNAGMVTMNHSIEKLLRQNMITLETASKYKRDDETKSTYY